MSKLWKEAFYESSTNKTLYRLAKPNQLPMQSKANNESRNSQGRTVNKQPFLFRLLRVIVQ